MFVHLTTHSAYSLQEGVLLPVELVQAAQAASMTALGLTDHRLLSGSVEFAIACKRAGVQPVQGSEIDLETGKLSLLATSPEGWSNLCRLSSALALRSDPEAACSLDLLASHSKDLILLSGLQGDFSGHRLHQLAEIFPDRLYLAVREPSNALPLSDLAGKLHLPRVGAHPV